MDFCFKDFAIFTTSASQNLVREINMFPEAQGSERKRLDQVSFLLPIRIDSDERLENLQLVTSYLYHYFDTEVIVMEADVTNKVDAEKLSPNVVYHFVEDCNPLFRRTHYNNKMIALSKTPYICLYDTDVILSTNNIVKAVEALRQKKCVVSYPYGGCFIGVDILMKSVFGKTLDVEFFERNIGKYHV